MKRAVALGCLLSLLNALPAGTIGSQTLADSALTILTLADSVWEKGTTPADYERARQLWAAAASLYERAGDARGAGRSLYWVGRAFHQLEQVDSAHAYYRRALPLRRRAGDRAGESEVLNWTGGIFQQTGPADSAFFYHSLALPIHRELRNRRQEASTLNSLGMVQLELGRIDSAIALYRASLPIRREMLDTAGEGRSLNNIGAAFATLGMNDSAVHYYNASLVFARLKKNSWEEGGLLNSIGDALATMGKLDSALIVFQSARDVFAKQDLTQGEATVLNSIGALLSRMGRPDSALVYARRSREMFTRIGMRSAVGITIGNIGWAHYLLNHPDSALTYYAEGLAIARESKSPADEMRYLNNVAEVFRTRAARGDAAHAVAYYDSAAALLATMAVHAGGDAERVSYRERGAPETEAWALTWLSRAAEVGSDAAALASIAVAERGRSQALLEMMRSPDRSRGATSATVAARAGADLVAEGRQLVRTAVRSGDPVLSYFLTSDTLVSWLLLPSGAVITSRHPLARDTLGNVVAIFRDRVGADEAARSRSLARNGAYVEVDVPARPTLNAGASMDDAARALASVLLPPELVRRLPARGGLVIVAHGPLALVPFGALPIGMTGDVVANRYAVRYAPSLATLGEAETRARARATRVTSRAAYRDALVVGNPTMPAVRDARGEELWLRPLPGADDEAQWVARRLGATSLSGNGAAESVVRDRILRAPIVHLATHGYAFASDARTRDSFVALAPGDGRDGLLSVGEVLDELPALQAELVVLSACQTGLGSLKQAEGTVGLQRAFLARGAHSVLVSLWSVSDDATTMLMRRFYSHWLDDTDHPDKAEALRRAQLDVRRIPGFESPRYWAAFQLVGAG
jgi:tetratricopeptide (TPR) repeat protein